MSTPAEGHYLVGILNAPTLTEQVRPLMSYGKDERHVDKAVWKLPIPAYDPNNPLHLDIANVARELADQVALLTFDTDNYVTIRQRIRNWLGGTTSGQCLDQLVAELLDSPTL